MSLALKRILIVVGLVAATCAIMFLLYYFFRSTTTTPTTTGGLPSASGTLPVSGQRNSSSSSAANNQGLPTAGQNITLDTPQTYRPEPVLKVSNDTAAYASVSSGGDVRYHNINNGKFYRVASDGSIQPLSDRTFYNVENVTWAKNKNQAVIEYPDGSNIVYNFDAQKQVTLPQHWQEFTFSPDGSEIAAKSMGLSPENRWLVTTKDDGTGTKLIEDLGNNADAVTMSWSPSRQTVAFSQTGQPLGADRREVLFVGLNGENFKSAIVEGIDFQPQWSPTGQKLLYSVDSQRSDFKPELWIVNSYGDSIGSNRQALKLNTWANKCTFADDTTLYCAVPQNLPAGAGMSPTIASSIPDDLYRIDLRTGLKTNIPTGGSYTFDTISVDKNSNSIFFTDKNSSGVYKVKL